MNQMLTTSPLNYPKATAPKVSLFQPSNAGASSRQGRGQGNNYLLWLRVGGGGEDGEPFILFR